MARRLHDVDVIAYDRRGYQGSRATSPVNVAGHLDDLVSVAHAVANELPLIYFGHSYGGVVALGTALLEPRLPSAIVSFEPPLPWVYHRAEAMSPVKEDPAEEAESFFRRMVSDSAWERLGPEGQADRRADGVAIHDDLTTLRSPAPFDVTSVTVPFTYAYGDVDGRAAYYAEVARRLVESPMDVTVRAIPGVGHGAHLSAPEHMVALVRERLER